MVTLVVIGLALSALMTGSATRTLLPQTRLKATADELGAALERARSWAVLQAEPLEFGYDLDHRTYAAWLPYETDEQNKRIGPGRTYKIHPEELQTGIVISQVRLPGGELRDKGEVILEISPMGRVPPHELVVLNEDHPDTEVLTVRVSGIANRCEVLRGDVTMEAVTDVDFR